MQDTVHVVHVYALNTIDIQSTLMYLIVTSVRSRNSGAVTPVTKEIRTGFNMAHIFVANVMKFHPCVYKY